MRSSRFTAHHVRDQVALPRIIVFSFDDTMRMFASTASKALCTHRTRVRTHEDKEVRHNLPTHSRTQPLPISFIYREVMVWIESTH